MTEKELRSYRLNSMEDPTDEMLEAIMEKVAEAAKESSRKAEEYIKSEFEKLANKQKNDKS